MSMTLQEYRRGLRAWVADESILAVNRYWAEIDRVLLLGVYDAQEPSGTSIAQWLRKSPE